MVAVAISEQGLGQFEQRCRDPIVFSGIEDPFFLRVMGIKLNLCLTEFTC